MDSESFDAVTRRVSVMGSRRGVLRVGASALAGLALGFVRLSGREDVAAENRRRKRRPKRCGAGGPCRVFVTSTAYGGNLGGLAGADAICRQLAEAANLPGTYKAWLSDGAASPSTRFVQSTGPYQLVNGTKIAANWTSLTDGALRAPINLTERGAAVADSLLVWTHTQVDGAAGTTADHCGNWGGAAGDGGRGTATYADANWTQSGSAACNTGQRLYCFQQSGR
ncbi:MAG TPA: hypothetical protein VFU81_12995 [Thermomicrobiales bacterium]|nr:hypothetical protein [Thermomicrobiales bacterium]